MRGAVIVLLLVCALPAFHHTVRIKARETTSLCEYNLVKDDATEILESTFRTFEDWARAYCLTDATIKILASQGLDSRGDILRLNERDIAALGLTTRQQTVLEVIVEKLEENVVREAEREAAQRKRHYANQGEVRRRQRSDTSMGDDILFGSAMGGLLGVGALIAAPYALAAAGFTSAGIAASSFAASFMSSTAVASGGGVAVGSTVAVLQSIGAAGIPAAVGTAVTTGGALVGGGAGYLRHRDNDEDDY